MTTAGGVRVRGVASGALAACLLIGCANDVGRDPTDEHERSELMIAAAEGDSARVARLLDGGARIDQSVRPHSQLRELGAFLMWMQDLPDRDDGYTALHYAIRGGHPAVARLLLTRGADPDGSEDGMPPLLLATLSPKAAELVPLLLEHGADVARAEAAGDPVAFVATRRDTTVMRLLLAAGADVNAGDPLISAAERGDSMMVEFLLAAGADPSRRRAGSDWTAAMFARERGHVAIAERLGGGAGSAAALTTELARAVRLGNEDSVRVQLEAGARATGNDQFGEPLVIVAVSRGQPAIVRLLLEHGASARSARLGVPALAWAAQLGDTLSFDALVEHGADARDPTVLSYAATAGNVPILARLHRAGANLRAHRDEALRAVAGSGDAEAVRFLLDRGLDPNAVGAHGLTALGRAVAARSHDAVALLLERGARPDGAGSWTPLMDAAMSGDTVMLDLLLRHGARLDRRNDDGNTAVEVATRAGRADVARWLRARSGG